MTKQTVFSLEELYRFSLLLLEPEIPKTIVLQGELGAGKTSFVRCFLQQFGLHQEVTSPTFTLMNIYSNHESIIHHFDLYRINNAAEASEWGFEEFVRDCDYAFIEWAERAQELIPIPHTLVQLEYGSSPEARLVSLSVRN